MHTYTSTHLLRHTHIYYIHVKFLQMRKQIQVHQVYIVQVQVYIVQVPPVYIVQVPQVYIVQVHQVYI